MKRVLLVIGLVLSLGGCDGENKNALQELQVETLAMEPYIYRVIDTMFGQVCYGVDYDMECFPSGVEYNDVSQDVEISERSSPCCFRRIVDKSLAIYCIADTHTLDCMPLSETTLDK